MADIAEQLADLVTEASNNPDDFSDWEFDFIFDIEYRVEELGDTSKLSGKQVEKIAELHKKHIAGG